MFRALLGILVRDTTSPILWMLYLSNFKLLSDATTDILLAGIFITNLEQADNVILISLTVDGAQCKMYALWKWCSVNFMIINAIKSLLMIYGSILKLLPIFRFGLEAVSIVKSAKYVGFNLNSTERNIFEDHYKKKASKARALADTLLGLESMVGTLLPWEARKLYMALVDPHLTHDCEVSLDVDLDLLKPLEDVQTDFLRYILGINKRAMIAPLFTETGLVPLRFRQVTLALVHLKYLAALNNDRYVRVAADDSATLSDTGDNLALSEKAILGRATRGVWSLALLLSASRAMLRRLGLCFAARPAIDVAPRLSLTVRTARREGLEEELRVGGAFVGVGVGVVLPREDGEELPLNGDDADKALALPLLNDVDAEPLPIDAEVSRGIPSRTRRGSLKRQQRVTELAPVFTGQRSGPERRFLDHHPHQELLVRQAFMKGEGNSWHWPKA
ncbi:hypothetical protein B0H10DRAFT_2438617 [Mycena sp. CBHHK59/15]|nr:hypothetical protein B0H10DRAFT_2438617 [Mycena sp. CBHHK59/15]